MTITDYQKQCFQKYKNDILENPLEYKYLYGNPINPVVPIETACNKVMIVGAYPSARFYKVGSNINVPLYDINAPFSDETYFDGSRIRCVPSGKELNEVILKKIGVERKDCWITNLVKVFLFKQGHIENFQKPKDYKINANRDKFNDFADISLKWLALEIAIAKPYVVILLGSEVTAAIRIISIKDAKKIMNGQSEKVDFFSHKINLISLPHPGILMRKTKSNQWPEKFDKEIAPKAKEEIEKLRIKAGSF